MTKTRRRTLVLVVVMVVLSLVASWFFGSLRTVVPWSNRNIFDEIYYDTQHNFRGPGLARLKKIPGVTSPRYGGLHGEYVGRGPEYSYKDNSTPSGYESIFIDFIFINTQEKTVGFYFTKIIEGGFRIHFSNLYDSKTRKLSITATFDEGEHTEEHEYDHRITQKLLAVHNITPEDLDSYNEAILNDVVLTDWTTVYNSRFSPDNYGDVEVTKQW